MSESQDDIDWIVTTWEGSRRAQLRHALKLTLRERLESAEGLADVLRRFEELRARRGRAGGAGAGAGAFIDTVRRE
jgi:hypothetical protein